MITVLGASGNTGGRVVERLRAEGERVRAVGRDAGRLAGAVGDGAEPFVGDATNPEFLRGAFDGADAAYVLMPMDVTAAGYAGRQAAVGTAIAEALGHAEMVGALQGAGMLPADGARLHVAMNREFNEGRVGSLAGRTPETTTPTTVEDWVASPTAVAR